VKTIASKDSVHEISEPAIAPTISRYLPGMSIMRMIEEHKSRYQRSCVGAENNCLTETAVNPMMKMLQEHKSRSEKIALSCVGVSADETRESELTMKIIEDNFGNLSLDELLNATFINKNDKKKKVFDKEALENLNPQEILIGAFIGSYKRVKLENFEESLDVEDICSVFEVYVKGVKQKEDETLDIYRNKLRKLKDYKP